MWNSWNIAIYLNGTESLWLKYSLFLLYYPYCYYSWLMMYVYVIVSLCVFVVCLRTFGSDLKTKVMKNRWVRYTVYGIAYPSLVREWRLKIERRWTAQDTSTLRRSSSLSSSASGRTYALATLWSHVITSTSFQQKLFVYSGHSKFCLPAS